MSLAARRCVVPGPARQTGIALIVSLLMLVVIMLLGTSAGQIALLGEKASRNDRDRLLAFQAAEAGLMDAEVDIEHSPDAARSRSQLFSKDSARGFPGEGDEQCLGGQTHAHLGLCKGTRDGATPAWLTVDFLADGLHAHSVPYGMFTGQTLQTGVGSLSGRLPRYIVELMVYNRQGESADKPSYFYRITAIGFGARDTTQVVLQTFYRKED
ncbi:MAG TPA: pilus assembly protein [Oxalobacteraceae bacterium]|jgi:type IV pilus assembly protein PilX|nr:pilus assembly protein [Oxalobacteraceae bacterium]